MEYLILHFNRLQTSVQHETWTTLSLFLFRTLLFFILVGERSLVIEIFSISDEIVLAQGATTLDSYVVWFGDFFFGVDLSEARPTTKDQLYSWVHSAAYLAFSCLAALVWSAIDQRKAHPFLKDGLWTLLRMLVAFYMFGYGCAKLFGVQFTSPTASQLMTELGTLSPGNLFKIFMGTSQPYSLLGGWLELTGGILLCYRKTTLLGALIVLGVMFNVFALNLFYSFGMKRFSLELIIFTLIIIIPYLPQLIKWILFNKEAHPISLYGPWTIKNWRWLGTGMMSIWLITMLSFHATSFRQFAIDYAVTGPRGDLDGTWEVIKMSQNGEVIPPLIGHNKRWRSLTLEQSPAWSQATANILNVERISWRLVTHDKLIELRSMAFDDDLSKTELKGTLHFTRPSPKHLHIKGKVEGVNIEAKLLHRTPKSFRLLSKPIQFIKD